MTTSTPTTETNGVAPGHDGRGVQDIVLINTNVSPVGIDTVRIHVQDFTVDNTADFRIIEQSDYSTGETQSVPLWKASDGTVITGDRAVLNTPVFQATVRSVDFLSVQSSLPKLLRGDNVCPVTTPGEFERALTTLKSQLEERGIRCSLSGRPLGRVDICRNVRTETPLADLEPLLKRLEAPYLGPRDNGHEGVKWVSLQGGRSDREITFYNKSEEAGLSNPNIQRLEYRLQRKRAVHSTLGSISTDDLCRRFTGVRSAFRGIVTELFPAPSSSDGDSGDGRSGSDGAAGASNGTSSEGGSPGQITSTQIRQLLRDIRSEHGQNCHAMSRLTWPLLLATHSDPGRLANALERAAASDDGPTRGKYQVRRKIRQARPLARRLSNDLDASARALETLRAKLLA